MDHLIGGFFLLLFTLCVVTGLGILVVIAIVASIFIDF